MADYLERDVTGVEPDQLERMIALRLNTTSRYRSLELIKRRGRLILRSWLIEFDISKYTKRVEPS